MADPDNSPPELILYEPAGHERHAEPGHSEQPARITRIVAALREHGAWDRASFASPIALPEDVLFNIHTAAHWERLKRASLEGIRFDPDTFVTSASWQVANETAGGAAGVAEAVWTRRALRGFALTRPPGHHATLDRAMGFCLLNNVALAAEYLIQAQGARRLAVFDFDLHHGNGTQDIFYSRDDVFYASTHQFPLYPGTGRLAETGRAAGDGSTLNVPLPPFSGDAALMTALEQLIFPALNRFEPEMLLVSAGFDAHWRDPLGHLLASAAGLSKMVKKLAEWTEEHCEGRLALFLEGGYDLEATAAAAQGAAASLMGMPWNDPVGPSPWPEQPDWQETIAAARRLWRL